MDAREPDGKRSQRTTYIKHTDLDREINGVFDNLVDLSLRTAARTISAPRGLFNGAGLDPRAKFPDESRERFRTVSFTIVAEIPLVARSWATLGP
jgi:hypothetical protein